MTWPSWPDMARTQPGVLLRPIASAVKLQESNFHHYSLPTSSGRTENDIQPSSCRHSCLSNPHANLPTALRLNSHQYNQKVTEITGRRILSTPLRFPTAAAKAGLKLFASVARELCLKRVQLNRRPRTPTSPDVAGARSSRTTRSSPTSKF